MGGGVLAEVDFSGLGIEIVRPGGVAASGSRRRRRAALDNGVEGSEGVGGGDGRGVDSGDGAKDAM